MSWSSWAKTLAKEAQRGIDIVLDINEEAASNSAPQAGQSNPEIGSTENAIDPPVLPVEEKSEEPPTRKGMNFGDNINLLVMLAEGFHSSKEAILLKNKQYF